MILLFNQKIKTWIANSISTCLHIWTLFPVERNKILYFPTNGHYYCNLKYIDKELEKYGNQFSRIWISKENRDPSYPESITYFNYRSFHFLYHFFTSKVVIFNDGLPSWLFKRSGQIFINTWHGGGAYKKIDAVYKNLPDINEKRRRKKIWDSVDYIISSCKKFTEVFQEDTGIMARALEIGMPRNDIFFNGKLNIEVNKKIKQTYGIRNEVGIVLYAPTFRDNGIKLDLNVEELLNSLYKRFQKKFVLFVRAHPHVSKNIFDSLDSNTNAIDVSSYSDMQELLVAADVLITDYSSSIWDFSFTGKPCFIYANDLDEYRKERNFHTPIETWPFPLSKDNKELQSNILHFDTSCDTSYAEALSQHHKDLGSFENGDASRKVCRLITDICYKK